MPNYGLQVYAPDGTVITDITDRLTKVFGNYSASVNSGSSPNPVVVSAPGVDTSGSYFAVCNSGVAMVTVGTGVLNVFWMMLGTYSVPITVFHC